MYLPTGRQARVPFGFVGLSLPKTQVKFATEAQ